MQEGKRGEEIGLGKEDKVEEEKRALESDQKSEIDK